MFFSLLCLKICMIFYCPFRCGDMILSVNNISLENVTHSKAVDVLKHATGAVSLRVVYWPGTAV